MEWVAFAVAARTGSVPKPVPFFTLPRTLASRQTGEVLLPLPATLARSTVAPRRALVLPATSSDGIGSPA